MTNLSWSEWRRAAESVEVGGLEVATYDLPANEPGAPVLTFLHGFPSSSLDVAPVLPLLDGSHRVLSLDLPGFGASDKPLDHPYSIHGATDAVEAMWAVAGVTQTLVVAHDYSVSVAQELLARGTPVEITGIVWLNGGLWPDLHRPTAGQSLLADPEHGPAIAAAIDGDGFVQGIGVTWGRRRPYDDPAVQAEMREMWHAVAEGGTDAARVLHPLLGYMRDRRTHADRWRPALEGCQLPMAFVWGALDPVSGGHVMERLVERFGDRPNARLVPLADVGHWPTLEAPDEVAAAVRSLA